MTNVTDRQKSERCGTSFWNAWPQERQETGDLSNHLPSLVKGPPLSKCLQWAHSLSDGHVK